MKGEKNGKLHVEYVPIDTVIPYGKNPRKNDEAVEYVANSIKEFGFKNPIIVDKDGVIIAGHTRLMAAKSLGIEEVPIIHADELTDEQVKAFRLADNKVAEIADWDFDLLDLELEDITDIDMSDFGFDLDDEEDVEVEEDEAPEPPTDPITKLGDLWQVGGTDLFVEILRMLRLLRGLWMG